MGDNSYGGDKGRDSRKKKFFPNNKEREDKNFGSRRLPIILTKPDGDKDKDGKYFTKSRPQENTEKQLSQPTIILRTRDGDNRAVSPSQRTKKENETPAPLYQLAAKHSSTDTSNTLALPVEMKAPVKLIDEHMQISDSCLEFLTDQTDFVVIGCVGLQGVGKSTLLSHLTGSSSYQLFNTVFKSQTMEDQRDWRHCTTGIDFYITSNRIIFLDCQPILSASIMDTMQDPKKLPPPPHTSVDVSSIENSVEIQSLQLTAFLMSVCHVVLLVQDWFYNPNLVRFMQTATMLKPPTNTSAEDGQLMEYFPHLMFIHTHCLTSDFTVARVKLMQEVYKQSFSKCMLQLHSGVGIGNGGVMQALSPSSLNQEPLNLFLLPALSEPDVKGHFQGHLGYPDLVSKLRQQLHGIGTGQLSTTQLSEKNWVHYSIKVWENIKKSTFFQEYSRLLP